MTPEVKKPRTVRLRLVRYLAVGGIFILGIIFGALLFSPRSEPTPPDLDDPNQWLLVKNYSQDRTNMTAQVYVIERLSNSCDPYTVLQNKIVITREGEVFEFRWADDREYAAGWCEVREDSGELEFFLYETPNKLRVVRFDGERFSFTPETDEYFGQEEIRSVIVDGLGDSRQEEDRSGGS